MFFAIFPKFVIWSFLSKKQGEKGQLESKTAHCIIFNIKEVYEIIATLV